MNKSLFDAIRHNMREKPTHELLSILEGNDTEEWSDEAFRAIEVVLKERNVTVPERSETTGAAVEDSPVAGRGTASPDGAPSPDTLADPSSTPQEEKAPDKEAKIFHGGQLPGFIASSVAVLNILFFLPDNPIVSLAVFIVVWLAYTGSVSESVQKLTTERRYKKVVWVTVLSNVTAIAVAIGMYSLAILMIGEELLAGDLGFMGRFPWAAWTLILSYGAYMAPGFLIAKGWQKGDWQADSSKTFDSSGKKADGK